MDILGFTTHWANNSIRLPDNNHESPSQQPYRLRPSRLGRHAYITGIEHLIHLHGNPHAAIDNSNFYGRMQDIFRTGHDVEARIVEVMRSAGMNHLDYQVPMSLEMHGYTIEGTADLVIDDTVIDIKTASASNYKRLISGYDDLTYRTQLALYHHALGVSNAGLLLYNKDTSEITYKNIILSTELERVSMILNVLRNMEDMTLEEGWDYMWESFEVTEPPQQMRDRKPTGKLLVPRELHYNDTVARVLWETDYHNGTRVIAAANPDPVDTIRKSFI